MSSNARIILGAAFAVTLLAGIAAGHVTRSEKTVAASQPVVLAAAQPVSIKAPDSRVAALPRLRSVRKPARDVKPPVSDAGRGPVLVPDPGPNTQPRQDPGPGPERDETPKDTKEPELEKHID